MANRIRILKRGKYLWGEAGHVEDAGGGGDNLGGAQAGHLLHTTG